MKKIPRKRTSPLHIKFLKKFELCELLYDDEEIDIWRIRSSICMRTHVTNKVKLIGRYIGSVKVGKYSNTPDKRLPKHEIERRKALLEIRDRYNRWVDVNDVTYKHTDVPIFTSKNSKKIAVKDHKRLARYMICENK